MYTYNIKLTLTHSDLDKIKFDRSSFIMGIQKEHAYRLSLNGDAPRLEYEVGDIIEVPDPQHDHLKEEEDEQS